MSHTYMRAATAHASLLNGARFIFKEHSNFQVSYVFTNNSNYNTLKKPHETKKAPLKSSWPHRASTHMPTHENGLGKCILHFAIDVSTLYLAANSALLGSI